MELKFPSPKKITVLLADDHPVTRAGIRAILNTAPDIQVIGEAASGFDVQEMLEELLPQILLLDLQMPEPRPSELEAWVRQNYPEVVTLVLTEHIPVKHEKWHLCYACKWPKKCHFLSLTGVEEILNMTEIKKALNHSLIFLISQ
ncbi:MAG: response regulator transcription factor [Anaerolineae bacterium]|nr:response regulator transcription factor [Anaerolineae bacterium]